MDRRMLIGLLIGMNLALIMMLATGGQNAVASTDRAERYIAVSGVDPASNRPVLFVIDTGMQRLMLYDVTGGMKLRCSSVRTIQFDSKPSKFELENKKGGAPEDFMRLGAKKGRDK